MRWFRAETPYRYPLERTFERRLPEDFAGEVYTWDVDNTYLRTDVTSFRAMLAIPFEMAIDKEPFPGVPELLQEIRRGPHEASRETPLLFVSASPTQMRRVLEQRMLIDGIEQDGFTLRDWGGLIRGGRFRKLKDPVGYKLAALLLNRLDLPPRAQEFLFGDDTEHDALIYTLYRDIVSGRLRGEELRERLLRHVARDDAEYVGGLADKVPMHEAIRGVFIHLAGGRGPGRLQESGHEVHGVEDYFQAALVLTALDQISLRGLSRVGAAVASSGKVLRTSFEDALRRGLIPEVAAGRLEEACGRPVNGPETL
jgi:uncharacterized protein DUF2183